LISTAIERRKRKLGKCESGLRVAKLKRAPEVSASNKLQESDGETLTWLQRIKLLIKLLQWKHAKLVAQQVFHDDFLVRPFNSQNFGGHRRSPAIVVRIRKTQQRLTDRRA
jgi:hypothetical protein